MYVINHGWHTGLILPYESLNEEPFIEDTLGYSPYYKFGWGDSDFYQAEKITSGITIKAILWPTDSVIHVMPVQKNLHEQFIKNEIIEIRMSQKGLQRLVDFISASFYEDKNSQYVLLGKGIYKNSSFFKARGGYQITNNCNTWVAEALESSGVPVSSFLTLTSNDVMKQSRNAMAAYQCFLH